ncbi:hypothetical protein N5W20_03760 [Candidatus Kirkpatrickella diaphorinae]|uniref:Secreted protein n=1 Tax=Candidatus Kirkpatrickella diaphorinae TaxID=2984322 RepID=A0ABY6GM76_9PROT|nr:hypothetical protein [Candidatus Kirkpatrickella diaphorinae]UYH51983.1 hypothetical protein N5W20_03760 [Candidatus Kirkpatrickella diaphorinae]
MRRYGLLATILALSSCGDPTPPPQTAEFDPVTQQQQLAAMQDEFERDNALAYQYQMMQAQQHVADEAAKQRSQIDVQAGR